MFIHVPPFSTLYITCLDNFFEGIGDINAPLQSVNTQDADKCLSNDTSQATLCSEGTHDERLMKSGTFMTEKVSTLPPIEVDRELERVSMILKRIHSYFYSRVMAQEISDVRMVLPEIKKTVLKGVKLVFSGVIPLDTDPNQ